MMKDQKNQISAYDKFDALQDQMEGNNIEKEKNENGLIDEMNDFEENANSNTSNSTGVNQNNGKKPDSEKKENFIEKKEYLNQKDQPNSNNKSSFKQFNIGLNYLLGDYLNNETEPKEQKISSKNFKLKTELKEQAIKEKSNPPDSSDNQMNSIPNDSQTNIPATLIDKIRISENKIIAIYKELNGNNIFVYEYTIGNYSDPNAEVDWFFPNSTDAYSYVYNYLIQKFIMAGNYKFYS